MFTEEMLCKAAEEANYVFEQYWHALDDENITFTKNFEHKMRKLIYRTKHPIFFRVIKSVACLLLAFLVSLVSIMTFNVEARADLLEWIKTYIPGAVVFHYAGTNNEELSNYRLTYLPEGYEEYLVNNGEDFSTVIYRNNEGKRITFRYRVAQGDTVKSIINENYTIQKVKIRDHIADLVSDANGDSSSNMVWIDYQTNLVFEIIADIAPDELIKMAENIIQQ